MARTTGPSCKLCRREGTKLFLKGQRCLSDRCAMERRPYPPGERNMKRRPRTTEYGLQLREKQKAKRMYGILERQFRGYFMKAAKQKGVTGENLLRMLEQRLDNVVYRLGFASSRAQARQLVSHGHFDVNGRRCNIPAALLSPGDTVSIRPSSRRSPYFADLVGELSPDSDSGRSDAGRLGAVQSAWLSFDPVELVGHVVSLPSREEIDLRVNEQLVVEYYSR